MQALYKSAQELGLRELQQPQPGPDQVLIAVRAAGLCRTDILIMQGRLPAIDPLIPGHELAGEILVCGQDVTDLSIGDAVTVHPLLGCGTCTACCRQTPEHCPDVKMLGQDLHGAFAEYLCVPARACYRLPTGLDWRAGAYTEPVAAALGILKANLKSQDRVLIVGDNRIAHLTRQVLTLKGVQQIDCLAEADLAPQVDNHWDWIIETGLNPKILDYSQRLLRPGGTLLLKSRHLQPMRFDFSAWVRKDLRLQGAFYGDFNEAVRLLANQQLELDSLLGRAYALADYSGFLADADNETRKRFLLPCVA